MITCNPNEISEFDNRKFHLDDHNNQITYLDNKLDVTMYDNGRFGKNITAKY
jgi:hypothetical protein